MRMPEVDLASAMPEADTASAESDAETEGGASCRDAALLMLFCVAVQQRPQPERGEYACPQEEAGGGGAVGRKRGCGLSCEELQSTWGPKRVAQRAPPSGPVASVGARQAVEASKNKNCHYCEHAPKRSAVFACCSCEQTFCENCHVRHLGTPTHFRGQDDADCAGWLCPICTQDCCCTLSKCDRDHLHCKRYRRKLKMIGRSTAGLSSRFPGDTPSKVGWEGWRAAEPIPAARPAIVK